MNTKQYKVGEVIFQEGSPGDTFYEIKQGSVGIYSAYQSDDEKKLTELGVGDLFGEMAVIEAYPRSATAVAGEEGAELLEISFQEIGSFFEAEPERITGMIRSLGKRVRALTKDYDEARATIAEMLSETSGDARSEGLMAKIKRYIFTYQSKERDMARMSVEAAKNASAHKEGFSRRKETYPAGTILFREGELGTCLYDVHWGKVGIFTGYGTEKQHMLTEILPDQFFGEMGMIEEKPRSTTAVVLENGTEVEVIEKEELAELFTKNPAKVMMVLEHLSHRLRRLSYDYLQACGIVSAISHAESRSEGVPEDVLRRAKHLVRRP